ncbi:hypothetical protein [Paenibacillus illinoisensis]|uniref:hypothetical protein n=1 Tax=Paenibacillus illinoisensis TaxID=59845 RepID=UPI00301D6D10
MKLTANQINIIEILTGTEGIDYETAQQIAIETDGDLTKARIAVSDLKLHDSHKNKDEL